MNLLFINTNFHEGGAAKIARQLYYGMKKRGHNVYFLAGYPSKEDEECIIMNPSAVQKLYNIGSGVLQNNQVITRRRARNLIMKIVQEKNIDVVHFHNVFENYVGIKDIAYISRHCKVVWTLHDMWAVTGHCAHAMECTGWRDRECIGCKCRRSYPAFYYNDVHYKFNLKKKSFTENNITFVVPSRWLEEICRESYLKTSRIVTIENGIDIEKYRPLERAKLREKYNVAEDQIVLLFTAAVVTNAGKGISYLVEALKKIKYKEKITLFTAGNGELGKELEEFDLRQMGFVCREEEMNELYNLADVYVNPSFAESFGCTAAEAAAAGTAVIAFASGGLKEIITEETGWLVEAGNTDALYETISKVTEDKKILEEKGINARKKSEELYSEQRMLDRYEKLYQEMQTKNGD